MARKLIMVRHGNLGEALPGRYIGRTDAPLSAGGRREAGTLAGEFARWNGAHILCSPLERCRETARIVLGGREGFTVDADLREIDFGLWEGMSFAEIAAGYPEAVAQWAALDEGFAFPGGEPITAFTGRIVALAGRIAADPAETVVTVSHGGVIRMLICHFLGLGIKSLRLFDIDTASVSVLRIENGRGVLALLNSRRHLGEN